MTTKDMKDLARTLSFNDLQELKRIIDNEKNSRDDELFKLIRTFQTAFQDLLDHGIIIGYDGEILDGTDMFDFEIDNDYWPNE